RFGSIEDARAFCQDFFAWYNGEHRHSGIGLLTPETVHYGKAELATSQRQLVLAAAFEAHQERFVRGTPRPPQLSEAAWINKPKTRSDDSDSSATQGSVPIERVPGHEPSGDHRSSGAREANSSDPAREVARNSTKFDEQVSQNY